MRVQDVIYRMIESAVPSLDPLVADAIAQGLAAGADVGDTLIRQQRRIEELEETVRQLVAGRSQQPGT